VMLGEYDLVSEEPTMGRSIRYDILMSNLFCLSSYILCCLALLTLYVPYTSVFNVLLPKPS
jgi:hypothetical protein